MAKGDDSIQRKKNKLARKKLHQKEGSSSASVSARVASIIASKKRRQSGKRRMCQGMCYSLPTLDDPFNDRQGKRDILIKMTKKVTDYQAKRTLQEKGLKSGKQNPPRPSKDVEFKETALKDSGEYLVSCSNKSKKTQKGGCAWDSDCPSKFLMLCLKTIENSLSDDDDARKGESTTSPLFMNSWGVEFWKLYEAGKDILETSGVSSSTEQIAWIVSTAADSIAKKEKEGLSFTSPFLLYLVPSKEKSAEVRSICKSLKALGVHTVSIHAGASFDHQIQGLKSCEPEFLVSTPERLLELISVKAVDISGISLLVVDGMGATSDFDDAVKSIRNSISGNPRTIVFKDYHCGVSSLTDLLRGSVQRLSHDDSVSSLSSCIVESVHVYSKEEDKLSKRREVAVAAVEQLANADKEEWEIVLMLDFVPSIDTYIRVLTKMAQYSIHDVLHSFVSEENSQLVSPLIELLEQCGQCVPKTLRALSHKMEQ